MDTLNNKWVIRRRKIENEKFIELDFEAPIEELRDVLLLGGIMAKILQEDDLPETKEFEVFTDFLFFSKRLSDAVPMEKIYIQAGEKGQEQEILQVTVSVTKREIKAALEVCTQGTQIIPRDENFTDRDANMAIALDSFRRRLMKAAGIKEKRKKTKTSKNERVNLFDEILQQNVGQTLRRRKRKKDEKLIELNFEAQTDELKEVLGLATIMAMTMNVFELPDNEEFDTFTDFLLFCKKISEAANNEEEQTKRHVPRKAQAIQIAIKTTEREIKATGEILSHGMRLAGLDEKMSDKKANSAILMESIRRRILKAAGMS